MPAKNKKKKGRTTTTNGGVVGDRIPFVFHTDGMNITRSPITAPGAMTPPSGSRLLPILSLDPRMTSFDISSPDNALPYAPTSSSSNDNAHDDDETKSEPSIPPLANREDSSSGSSSCNSRLPTAMVSPQMTTNTATTDLHGTGSSSDGTNIPSSVHCDESSSSSSGEMEISDDEDDDDDDSYDDDDETRSFDEYDDDDEDDSDEDDMPALVLRDESSHDDDSSRGSSASSTSRLALTCPRDARVTAPITPSPSGAMKMAKKKKNKKKKKGAKVLESRDDDDDERPSSDLDLDYVRGLLSKYGVEGRLDEGTVLDYLTRRASTYESSMTDRQRAEHDFQLELARVFFRKLSMLTGVDDLTIVEIPAFDVRGEDALLALTTEASGVLRALFRVFENGGVVEEGGEENQRESTLWTLLDDTTTSRILEAALYPSSVDSLNWFKEHASDAIETFALSASEVRQRDVTVLLERGFTLSCKSVATLFSNLPKGRGIPFNNKAAKLLNDRCTLVMKSQSEYKLVMDAVSDTVGKSGKANIAFLLKQARNEMNKTKSKLVDANESAGRGHQEMKNVLQTKESKKAQEESEKRLAALKLKTSNITEALQWYNSLLDELNAKAAVVVSCDGLNDGEVNVDDGIKDSNESASAFALTKKILTPEQVMDALTNCDSEELLTNIESGIDLTQWDGISEWTIDITEQVHKFFQRHIKRERALCQRVLRRLALLSTGRWPYVLCKPLKAKQGQGISLYETKIDAASRIIWEVAIAFSPRRSNSGENFAEQVIRVWDIVLDHDNLSRAIDQTIDRIERSHKRGEECAIASEIDKSVILSINSMDGDGKGVVRIPRVFSMSNQVTVGSNRDQVAKGKSRHFHPASDDPRQYTLLKFYELNQGAVKLLLDGREKDNSDLPFMPGPKEHEIIHYQSDPQRSILLSGRSGTGKTTCLVFRLWAQHTAYYNSRVKGARPRQLFLTKNDLLCREVKRSFNNMGLAWAKRHDSSPTEGNIEEAEGNIVEEEEEERPQFFTSSEWFDALDAALPGQSFFSKFELQQRINSRKHNDSVTKEIEELLLNDNAEVGELDKGVSTTKVLRQEMTYLVFRKLWRKIRSGSDMECTIVWREIKSFIKGSVPALQIDRNERSLPQNRFLSLDEYLTIPRKQSRMDEAQRREVYGIFQAYEKLKAESFYYDECDLIYNIAGRISSLDRNSIEIDSLFIDEVQDFTQAEIYILVKICRNPNNLFLAGDTAQSITVGVDFRFTDVRQIFYNHFGGIEPKLLQLSHNYRSHSGVLRLAACVVELLYHFFGSSLDKLPPDLGLFSGPKPVIMDVANTQELVLMLQGAKRKTSRIEFGAHQVVIVRSEEAKRSLPEKLDIDKDWVMTVQESKGLEFDDVLLYDFFSDSPAEDLWRIVSGYTEKEIEAYYQSSDVVASGVQKFDWESPMLSETRHLDFNSDQHKIIECELKMLYTAITRARVNVFIAETNKDFSRPMFNYFQRRCVVDVMGNTDNEALSSVRVFGAMNTVEDWRNRGEYYLRNAEGDRTQTCLRLAAKCFDKAGEANRRDYALAFLSFVEIEEQDQVDKSSNTKLRGKHSVEVKEKLYSVTEQMLEARDLEFLSKAALCLLKTGEQDLYTAELFELYARLCYSSRICNEAADATLTLVPTSHEKKYFTYAATLFAKCSQQRGIVFDLAIQAFRNYVCGGAYDEATELLTSGALPIDDRGSFHKLYSLCIPLSTSNVCPTSAFRRDFKQKDGDSIKRLITAVKECATKF